MWVPTRRVLLAPLLVLLLALIALPGAGLARDDNSNDNRKKDDTKQESSRQTNDKPASAKPSSSPQTVVPAGAKPDLTIMYAGFSSPTNVQLIKFKVTNVGTAPSSATAKVGVVTSTPEPTPWYRELDLPSLKPGESTEVYYPLAADCNGHRVYAVTREPLDVNQANNSVEQLVCSGAPVPTSPGGPVSDRVASPTNDRSVDHGPFTWPLAPVAAKTLRALKDEGGCSSDGIYSQDEVIVAMVRTRPFPLMAGFANSSMEEILADCQTNGVWQAAFRFDLTEIRGEWAAGRLVVVDMELTFEETPFVPYFSNHRDELAFSWSRWVPPDVLFNPEPTQTCWPRLARPTVDWSNRIQLVPNEALLDAKQIGSFPLLGEISGNTLAFPENDNLGFLILGHNEEMHFNQATCLSKIEAVQLIVTYVTR